MKVKLTQAIIVNGLVCGKGEVVEVEEGQGKLLIALKDAEPTDEPIGEVRHGDPKMKKR